MIGPKGPTKRIFLMHIGQKPCLLAAHSACRTLQQALQSTHSACRMLQQVLQIASAACRTLQQSGVSDQMACRIHRQSTKLRRGLCIPESMLWLNTWRLTPCKGPRLILDARTASCASQGQPRLGSTRVRTVPCKQAAAAAAAGHPLS